MAGATGFEPKRLVAFGGESVGRGGGTLKAGKVNGFDPPEGGAKADSGGVFGRFFAGSGDSSSKPGDEPHCPKTVLGEAGLGFSREGEEGPAENSLSLPPSPRIGTPARGELRAGRAEGLLKPMPNGEVGLGKGKVGLSLAGDTGGVVLAASTLAAEAGSTDGSCTGFPLGVSLGDPGTDSEGVVGSGISAGDKSGDFNIERLSAVDAITKSPGAAEGDLDNGKGIFAGSGDLPRVSRL